MAGVAFGCSVEETLSFAEESSATVWKKWSTAAWYKMQK